MKCIFLILLVLPSVLCHIIVVRSKSPKHREHVPVYSAKVIKHRFSHGFRSAKLVKSHDPYRKWKEVLHLKDGYCFEQFRTEYLKIYTIPDLLNGGIRSIQSVRCAGPDSGEEKCQDVDTPAQNLYFCKEIVETIEIPCLSETESPCFHHVTTKCHCGYHRVS